VQKSLAAFPQPLQIPAGKIRLQKPVTAGFPAPHAGLQFSEPPKPGDRLNAGGPDPLTPDRPFLDFSGASQNARESGFREPPDGRLWNFSLKAADPNAGVYPPFPPRKTPAEP